MSFSIMSRSEDITCATGEIMDQDLKEEVVVIEETKRIETKKIVLAHEKVS